MKEIRPMSEAEYIVMQVIWAIDGDVSLTKILDKLALEDNKWKKTTVQTFLSRLCSKNILIYEKVGRNSIYRALITEEGYQEAMTKDFIAQVYKGNATKLIASLLQKDNISKEEIDELYSFWQNSSLMSKPKEEGYE